MPDLHHEFGPSSLGHLAVCAGFKQNQNQDQTKADLGTLQHKAFETRDLSILPTPEMVDAVSKCIAISDKLAVGADEVHREVRLDVCGGRTFGTSDEVIIKGDTGHVLDEKYGLLPVTAAGENLQVWAYVSGVFDRWPNLKQVTGWLLLPYQNTVDRHTFNRAQLPEMKATLLRVLHRAEDYKRTANPKLLRKSMDTCQYCARLGKCELTAEFAVAVARKYEPLEIPEELHSSLVTSPERMVELQRLAPILEKLSASIKKHAMEMAVEQGGLRGADGELVYEIAEKNAPRKLDKNKLPDAVRILRENGLTDVDLLMCSDISITAAIDLAASKAPRGQKAKARGALEAALQAQDILIEGTPTRYLKKVKRRELTVVEDSESSASN